MQSEPIANTMLKLNHRTGLLDMLHHFHHTCGSSIFFSNRVSPCGINGEVIQFHGPLLVVVTRIFMASGIPVLDFRLVAQALARVLAEEVEVVRRIP